MSNPDQHIAVVTGAGISAESGLPTFRDRDGLWEQFPIEEVATPQAWKKDRSKVLHFYNIRRQQVRQAKPNAAHIAVARLQVHFKVSIITQNIDDLHERAGSKQVLHLHGEIMLARSTLDPSLRYALGDKDIHLGDHCERGSQLRPHVVWFGESVPEFEKASAIARQADLLLVIGTSLQVYPAASLMYAVRRNTPTVLVAPEVDDIDSHVTWFKGTATQKIPELVAQFIREGLPAA